MKNNLLIILVLITVIPSCKKSVLETRTNNLTNGSWRLTAHVYSNAFGTTNVYAVLPDCRKDDYRRFTKTVPVKLTKDPTPVMLTILKLK
ncbi:MAG: hypothetical protein IPO53_10325, partial [Chitinophagaceae bacterium]|nr:hypothetical protein [Chitinophagaceae bacterium]